MSKVYKICLYLINKYSCYIWYFICFLEKGINDNLIK